MLSIKNGPKSTKADDISSLKIEHSGITVTSHKEKFVPFEDILLAKVSTDEQNSICTIHIQYAKRDKKTPAKLCRKIVKFQASDLASAHDTVERQERGGVDC